LDPIEGSDRRICPFQQRPNSPCEVVVSIVEALLVEAKHRIASAKTLTISRTVVNAKYDVVIEGERNILRDIKAT
jgi:hypothetical protein